MSRLLRFARHLGSGERLGFAALQSVLSQSLIVALNLLTGVLTARVLGPDGRGAYAAISLWPTVLGMAAVAGIADATLIQLRRNARPPLTSALVGMAAAAVLSTVLAAAAWAAMPVLLGEDKAGLLMTARYALLFTYVTALGALLRNMFAGLGAFRMANLATLLPHLFHAIFLLALAGSGRLTVLSTLVSAIAAGVVSLAVLFPPLWSRLGRRLGDTAAAWKAMFDFSARAAWSDLLGLMTTWSHRVVLIPMLSARDLGLYLVAYGFSRVLTVATPSAGLVLSALSESSARAAKPIHDLTLRISIATLTLVVLLSEVLASHLLVFFYGVEFSKALQIVQLLILQSALNRLASITAQLYSAGDRPGFNSSCRGLEVAVSVGLMIVLTPTHGGVGAAWAVLTGTALRLIVSWVGIVQYLRLPFPRLWLNRQDLHAARALFS
jgi:O-antigen/teichoic acid export membrane protein